MRYFLLTACLLICSVLSAGALQLKAKLAEAQPGSYIVIEQNKTFTFFHIYNRFDQSVVIEEVSIPAASFARKPMNWKVWFESGAPGHTSWIISQVNINTGLFEETFSFTHQGWINMSSSNPFLTTLLNLPFQEIPVENRRRVGGNSSGRPLWNPRLIVNGAIVPNTSFYAYKARWPSDGSELARKVVEIYLPVDTSGSTYFPSYFPYWLEVDGKIGSAKARVVDSGFGASSPKPSLPKRTPQLIGDYETKPDGIVFKIKSPLYYREFTVFAEEQGSFFGNMTLLPCSTTTDGETISLFISQNELDKLNQSQYNFLISPTENPAIVLETRPIFCQPRI
jgi:hypothetical protein